MRIGANGRVTIPAQIRTRCGLLPGTEVELLVEGESVRIVRASRRTKSIRREQLVARLRGRATAGLTTDAIMALTRRR